MTASSEARVVHVCCCLRHSHLARPGASQPFACTSKQCLEAYAAYVATRDGADGLLTGLDRERAYIAAHPALAEFMADPAVRRSKRMTDRARLLMTSSCAPLAPPPFAPAAAGPHGRPLAEQPGRSEQFATTRLPVAASLDALGPWAHQLVLTAAAFSCRTSVKSAREAARHGVVDGLPANQRRMSLLVRRLVACAVATCPEARGVACVADEADEEGTDVDSDDASDDESDGEAAAATTVGAQAEAAAAADAAAAVAEGMTAHDTPLSCGAAMLAAEAEPGGGLRPSDVLLATAGCFDAMSAAGYAPNNLRNDWVRARSLAGGVKVLVEVQLAAAARAAEHAAAAARLLRVANELLVTADRGHSEQHLLERKYVRLLRTGCVALLTGALAPPSYVRWVLTAATCEAASYITRSDEAAGDEERAKFQDVAVTLCPTLVSGRITAQQRLVAGLHVHITREGRMELVDEADKHAEAGAPPSRARRPFPPRIAVLLRELFLSHGPHKTWREACAAKQTMLGDVRVAAAVRAVSVRLTGLALRPSDMRRAMSSALDSDATALQFEVLLAGESLVAQAAVAELLRVHAQRLVLRHSPAIALSDYYTSALAPLEKLRADGLALVVVPLSAAALALAAELRTLMGLNAHDGYAPFRVYDLAPALARAWFPRHAMAATAATASKPQPVNQGESFYTKAVGRKWLKDIMVGTFGCNLDSRTWQRAALLRLSRSGSNPLKVMADLAAAAVLRGISRQQLQHELARVDASEGVAARTITDMALALSPELLLHDVEPLDEDDEPEPITPRAPASAPLVNEAQRDRMLRCECVAALPDGGRAVLAALFAAAKPTGGAVEDASALAKSVFVTAACFEDGWPAVGVQPRTSLPALLSGPPEALAAFAARIRSAVSSGAIGASQAQKVLRMMRAVANACCLQTSPAVRAAHLLLSNVAHGIRRADGGSVRSAAAAAEMARAVAVMDAMPAVAQAVEGVLARVLLVLRSTQGQLAGNPRLLRKREELLPEVASALFVLGVGEVSTSFVEDMELGRTVYLTRERDNTAVWRYLPSFLHGKRPCGPESVPLPEAAQALLDWLVATMPGPSLRLFSRRV